MSSHPPGTSKLFASSAALLEALPKSRPTFQALSTVPEARPQHLLYLRGDGR